MLFSSAYATVMGVLPPLITDKTAVISDALNHNCIINAIALARPAEKRIYRHLDLDELERHLAAVAKTCTRAIVVTDGVFSMRGDHAPLDAIMQLIAEFDARLSGERHPGGRRLARRRRLRPHRPRHRGGHRQPARSTCSSARSARPSASTAATSSASNAIVGYLRETSPFYIYSNPITPGEAEAALRRRRSRRQPGGPRRARSPARDDGALPQGPDASSASRRSPASIRWCR